MQRVAPHGAHIVGLGALLRRDVAGVAPQPAIETPDPAELLEAERRQVLQAAEEAGFAQGQARAEQEIQARAQAAEQRAGEACAEAEKRLVETNGQLALLLRNLPDAVAGLEARMEPLLVEVAYAAVTRMLGTAAGDGELIERLCRQALAEFRQRPVVLRVSPRDRDAVAGLAGDADIRIEPDALLGPGQCRLETHKGLYDTGLEARLEALAQALLQGLQEGGEAS